LAGNRRLRLPLIIALAVALPIVAFSAVSLASQLPAFFDPCMSWGVSSGTPMIASPAGPCTTSGATSETIPQAILALSLIQGGILFAFGLGAVGAARYRPTLLKAASAILFLESIPFVFDGLFVLTLPPAALFLWASRARDSRPSSLTSS